MSHEYQFIIVHPSPDFAPLAAAQAAKAQKDGSRRHGDGSPTRIKGEGVILWQ